jgi:hypothetical protein
VVKNAVAAQTWFLPLRKKLYPPPVDSSTNLPGQWLQCQANGSNVGRVLKPSNSARLRGARKGLTPFFRNIPESENYLGACKSEDTGEYATAGIKSRLYKKRESKQLGSGPEK